MVTKNFTTKEYEKQLRKREKLYLLILLPSTHLKQLDCESLRVDSKVNNPLCNVIQPVVFSLASLKYELNQPVTSPGRILTGINHYLYPTVKHFRLD